MKLPQPGVSERHGCAVVPPLVGVALVAAASLVLFERFSPIPAVPDAPADAAMTAAVPATRLLDVLPQQDGGRFVLQLLLDRSISYQRTDEGGAISLRLPDVTLAGGPQSGRVESNGLSLSRRVEQQGDPVQVLLIGMTDRLDVRDRLEPAAGHAQLWLEVHMDGAPVAAPEDMDLPFAEPALDEASLPEWVTRTAPDAQAAPDVQPVAEPARAPAPVARPRLPPRPPCRSAVIDRTRWPGARCAAAAELHPCHRVAAGAPCCTARQCRGGALVGSCHRRLGRSGRCSSGCRPSCRTGRSMPSCARCSLVASCRAATSKPRLPPGAECAVAGERSRYHALLAALQQQVGDWTGSAAVYRQLVAFQPQQAAWQLGLAIALEQIDQPPGRHATIVWPRRAGAR